jgi:hypothetical protein
MLTELKMSVCLKGCQKINIQTKVIIYIIDENIVSIDLFLAFDGIAKSIKICLQTTTFTTHVINNSKLETKSVYARQSL